MSDLIQEPDHATVLTEEERRGLRLPVTTRAELNQVEAQNISTAMTWLFFSRRKLLPASVVNEQWLKRLHWRMYSRVWTWAGRYRSADCNLGVPCWQVGMSMRDLEADALAWLGDTNPSKLSDDECAVRLGYRLVAIHPFPNGNGRWSRLASDALAVALGGRQFSWGGASLTDAGQARRRYIRALRAADSEHDLSPLLAFARS
jgi:Fic-DOC domain mobile mystery protein B